MVILFRSNAYACGVVVVVVTGRNACVFVENNEHLGQIVSGVNQEEKNIDLKLSKGRKNLFGLLDSPSKVSLAL